MAAALKKLFEKRNVALAKAKFRAWWEGVEFDEAAALAAIEAGAAANDAGDSDSELFDAPEIELDARLKALAQIWGDGRIRPGEDGADALEPARLGAPEDGVVAVSGAGLSAPVIAFAGAYAGSIDAFEWREETIEALRYGVRKAKLDARVNVARIDLDAHVFQQSHYDGVWSVDDFAYIGYPPHLAQQIAKMLKPGACAVVECYIGQPSEEFATSFASAFAEPQIRPHGDMLQFFRDVGLGVEAEDDITEEFLNMARAGFKRLSDRLADPSQLEILTARELAWEAEAWRSRLKLLAGKRLERRRFILRKQTAEAAEAEAAAALAEAARLDKVEADRAEAEAAAGPAPDAPETPAVEAKPDA